jgi:universal stress protein A
MKAFKKILVPTDFSEFSLAGMDHAISLAVSNDAEIYVLTVVDNQPPVAFPAVDHHSETMLRDYSKQAEALLDRLIEKKFRGMRNIIPIVRRGNPAKEIVRLAREEGVDLIVMATHGRTGLAHVVIGSVAEKVVRLASVPVLVVKPQEVSDALLNEEDVEEQLHLKL